MPGEGGRKCIETGENEDDSWSERPSQGIIVSTGRTCGRKKSIWEISAQTEDDRHRDSVKS
jgi:hypothetical protein